MAAIELRLAIFLALFVGIALCERAWPRRTSARGQRWITNFALLTFNTALLRLVSLPALTVAAAFGAEHRQWGLLPALKLPDAVAFIAALVALDLAVYGQHVAMHAVPSLWRMHRVHHADAAFDVTTGLRFHALEMLLSQRWKIGVVVLFGVPLMAALVFESGLNASSMFAHANLKLPRGVERWLRLVLVTPDMHRVHHSVERDERDTNYGFNLSLWDRLFATYRAQPRAPYETMAIGLGGITQSEAGNFVAMLRFPFVREVP